MKRLIVFALFLLLIFSMLAVVPQAKADNKGWSDYLTVKLLNFRSIGELNEFFVNNKFIVANYKDTVWVTDVSLIKSQMYRENQYYVLAPYSYIDKDGYLHKITPDADIYLSDIPQNVTIIITGFSKGQIYISNFGGKVILGGYVNLAHTITHDGWDWGTLAQYLIPVWGEYKMMNTLWEVWTMRSALQPSEFVGLENTAIQINHARDVVIRYTSISTSLTNPISISDVRNVLIDSSSIQAGVKTEGAGVSVKNVDTLTFKGINSIGSYQYNLYLDHVKHFKVNGTLTLNGLVLNPQTGEYSSYGMGIYAYDVSSISVDVESVNMEVTSDYTVLGLGSVNVTGTWDNATNYFVGHNAQVFLVFFEGTKIVPVTFTLDTVSGYVNLSKNSSNQSFSGSLTDHYTTVTLSNATLGYSLEISFRFQSLSVVNHPKIINGTSTLDMIGVLKPGSYIRGTIPKGVNFANLQVALGLRDNGSKENALVEYVKVFPNMVNVEQEIRPYATYYGEHVYIDAKIPYEALVAAMTFLVAFAFVRWAYFAIMHNETEEDRARNKELLKQIVIGAMIVFFVLYDFGLILEVLSFP